MIGDGVGVVLTDAIGSGAGGTPRPVRGEHRCVTFFAAKLARHVRARSARARLPSLVESILRWAIRFRSRTEIFRHASVQYR